VPVLIGGSGKPAAGDPLRLLVRQAYAVDPRDSGADLLVYGMGELPLVEVIRLVKQGCPSALSRPSARPPCSCAGRGRPRNKHWEDFELHSTKCASGTARSTAKTSRTSRSSPTGSKARRLLQRTGDRLLSSTAVPTMSEGQIDSSFDLPYTRLPHPKYRKRARSRPTR